MKVFSDLLPAPPRLLSTHSIVGGILANTNTVQAHVSMHVSIDLTEQLAWPLTINSLPQGGETASVMCS